MATKAPGVVPDAPGERPWSWVPWPPMRLYRVIGAVGRTMIGLGVLILLFVAYQLWGTGIHEARAQDRLKDQFEEQLSTATTVPETTRPDATTTTTEPAPPPPEGEAVAIMRIPRIGIEKAVVEGVGVSDLKKGPGHYPGTPLPGQPGNAAIAGHRTTYGAPFGDLGELQPGDEILVTTRQGDFRYVVDRSMVVEPHQVEVLDPTTDNRLTLTTCHPKYTARERLVVQAVLEEEPAPAPPPTTVPDEPEPVAFEDPGLSGESASTWPAALWGGVAFLIGLITWVVGHEWRRLPAYALGAPVFLVALFVFFEQVARLLPANV